MSRFPRVFRLRQQLADQCLADVPQEVADQLSRLELEAVIQPGQSVAITAGSRGIAGLAAIVKATVDHVRRMRARPFIVPAMGSHAGATTEGQVGLLGGYGVTAESCGCDIRATMDTVALLESKWGFPLFFDAHAAAADHVILLNRVKPHTGFAGEFQSGLMKMLLIGLGKHDGARMMHRAAYDHDFDAIVREVGDAALRSARVAAGLAIVENGHDETALIEAVSADNIIRREPELLRQARKLMAKLPFRHCDVLIVDEIGKNISGTGMDTNVIGRKYHDHAAADHEFPKIRRIAVRGLTPASAGNGQGIGMAEFCLRQVIDTIDLKATYVNAATSGHVTGAMLPMHFDSDREMVTGALSTLGLTPPEMAQLLWIRNTLDLEELWCSESYLKEAEHRDDLQVLSPPRPLQFDAVGKLSAES